VYRYWRKNRRDNGDGSYGVDLNRNYGFKWGYDDEGSSPQSNSYTFRGPAPFSEPETQAIRRLCEQHLFQAMISYHNYSQLILYPWGYTSEPADQKALLHKLGQEMSELIEPVNGRYYEAAQSGVSLYLSNGDTTDWALGIIGIPSFTVELPPVDIFHGEFFNSEEDIQSIFNENLPAMLYLAEWALEQKINPSMKNEYIQIGKPVPKKQISGKNN
jgi:hypothetical protein